jgi:hypothetical protein
MHMTDDFTPTCYRPRDVGARVRAELFLLTLALAPNSPAADLRDGAFNLEPVGPTATVKDLLRGYTAEELSVVEKAVPAASEPAVPIPVARQISVAGRVFVDRNGNRAFDHSLCTITRATCGASRRNGKCNAGTAGGPASEIESRGQAPRARLAHARAANRFWRSLGAGAATSRRKTNAPRTSRRVR